MYLYFQLRKLQRQLRDLKEEYANLQQRETEAHSKKNELEKQIEISEAETTTVKNDLKLALKRVEDLQTAINGELDSDSDSLNRYPLLLRLWIRPHQIYVHPFSDNDSDSSDDELSSHLLSASRRGSSLSRDSPAGSRTGKPLETMAEESET